MLRKGPLYWLEFLMGFIKGRSSGMAEAKKAGVLLEKYGTLERIPTRDLIHIGKFGNALADRQRVKIAVIYLNELLSITGMRPIEKTLDIVILWLEFGLKDQNLVKRMNAIAASESVIYSLVDLAVEKDNLNKDGLLQAMQTKKKLWVWQMYGKNDFLMVT